MDKTQKANITVPNIQGVYDSNVSILDDDCTLPNLSKNPRKWANAALRIAWDKLFSNVPNTPTQVNAMESIAITTLADKIGTDMGMERDDALLLAVKVMAEAQNLGKSEHSQRLIDDIPKDVVGSCSCPTCVEKRGKKDSVAKRVDARLSAIEEKLSKNDIHG